uniref:Vitellogenin n=1 Tax=Maruca vitrata TaxID=497515 RepID=A0A385HVZ9_MARVT|nr:vitellogenin [Maruca vitrata]
MKILVLAALIAAVATSHHKRHDVDQQTQGPWRVGTLYKYDVDSYTVARLSEGSSSGNAFQARFVVRAYAPGRLLARLENPQHAQVHQELPENRQLPADLKYQPVDKLDQPFEINVDGGRVESLNLPANLPLAQENLLKGLISGLQYDLSTHRHARKEQNGYDQQTQQGMFKKMETDVTGDCETLYDVHQAVPEWRRVVPNFANEEQPIAISKTKNYGRCNHRVAYHFGVPQGSEWVGTAHWNHEEQFIRRAMVSKILAGKQGPIYKSETTSTVHVNPQVYGKEKAEVLSYVQLTLVSYEQDSQPEWQRPQNNRQVDSLLYSITQKQAHIRDWESSSESDEVEREYQNLDAQQRLDNKYRMRRSAQSDMESAPESEQQYKQSASYSSSETDNSATYVNDDMPKNNEPSYAAMEMTPQARAERKQNPVNAQKLAQEMAQQLQNPNSMPKGDFLSKFNILVRIISSMSSEQLALTSRAIEVAKSSNNKVKADMWMIYRDAVAQAGTLPAFQQIKIWIQKKTIQEEEAAQVLASQVNTLRYPTKEIMVQFFRLALSEEVKQQRSLNSTALIAATRLINQAQVNNETARTYYPSYMYGRMSRQHDSFVQDEILPRLSEELKEAIQQGDSNKAQVYIKAIGNVGHRGILQVFAPYLEGKIPTSTYLRMQMVKSLQVLSLQKDRAVRAVLFAILRNEAEEYEVRVAAIDNILMTRPDTSMMQAMAQMTHNDTSVHVRAVLKSGIEWAAELKNIHFLDLARAAQAAKWMLTKEDFGQQYSNKYLNNFSDDESELDILSSFAQIGSEDSLFPKSLRYSIKTKAGGWDKGQTIGTSFSSVQRFVNVFQQQMNRMTQQKPRSEAQHKYSADKIAEMLNIKREPQEPLEAALRVAIMGQERYFAFNEEDMRKMPSAIAQLFASLNKGAESHYTKVLNQEQVSIMFPVANGMPFIYKYKTPTVVHFQGKAKGQVNTKPEEPSADINGEVQLTYARNIDGRVGFMNTLTSQLASVGVTSKFQMNLPLKMQMQVKSGDMKIKFEPLRADQDSTIIHFSVWPYSSIQNKDSLETVGLDKTTKSIARNNKVVNIDNRFGQAVGNQFQLQGYSYSSDYQNLGKFISQDFLTTIANALYQKDVALTHFNLRYLGKQSPNNRITLTASLDTYYNQKHAAQPLVASNVADVTPNSDARRQEMVKRVGAGINSARVQVLDMSATLEGQQKHEFVITAAMGASKVDNKIQYAFFAGGNSALLSGAQVNGVLSVNKPVVTSLNFLEALQKEMKMNFEADIKYGQKGHIHMNGQTERSQKYAEQLMSLPEAKECALEIERNNFYQPACYEMIVKAHAPDYLKASINYEELSPALRKWVYKTITMAQFLGYWYTDVNSMKITPQGKFEIESQLSYLENSMSLSLGSIYGDLRFNNVPIPKVTPYALAIYSPISSQERVFNYFTSEQYQPSCTVDVNQINTFSNRQYEYTLSRSWHVVIQDDGSRQGKDNEQLVVLARRPNEQQQEIYISYKSQSGKDLELEIQPAAQPNGKHSVKVNSNGKKVAEGDLTIYWDDAEDQPLLQYHTQPDGVLMVNIGEGRLRALYDGRRLVLLARQNRNNLRGICGYMNGEPRYDYLTPTGIVDRPEHYAASYALNDDQSDPKTQQLQSEAKKLSYQPENQYTAILPADQQWKRANSRHNEDRSEPKVYKSRSYQKSGDCQMEQQMQYYEDHSEICVTTESVPACQSKCRGEGYKVQKFQVTCRPKADIQFRAYRDQIRRGQNPKMVEASQGTRWFQVPSSCRA